MSTNQKTKGRLFKTYLKKYGYLVLIGVALLTLTITLLAVGTKGPQEDPNYKDPSGQVNATVKTYLPVADATVIKEFSDTQLMYNGTLKQWEAHKSIDFSAEEGSDVVAYTDGTVIDVSNNYLNGTVVTVEHANGLKTIYGSLQEDVSVKKGDAIKGGSVIGKVGATANSAIDLGSHLNFQMVENDKKIDPSGYLNLASNK